MIAVSIAMAIWTAGLQIVQRRATLNRVVATEVGMTETVEKQMISDAQKV